MTLQLRSPSPRIETPTTTPNVEPQNSPQALGEGGTTVQALSPYHQPQTQSEAEIDEAKVVSAFNARWGFAGIGIASDLKSVWLELEYDTRRDACMVVNLAGPWAADWRMPLKPLLNVLKLVAETAQEEDANDVLEQLRNKVDAIVGALCNSTDQRVRDRGGTLMLNLPASLDSGKD